MLFKYYIFPPNNPIELIFDSLMSFGIYFGMYGGVMAGFSFFGLIGGLIALFLSRKGILKLPNYKISIFTGFLVFSIFPLFLLALSTEIINPGRVNWEIFILSLFIPLFHILVILVFLTFFERKNIFNNYYWAFITSYLISCFILSFIPLFFGFLMPIS